MTNIIPENAQPGFYLKAKDFLNFQKAVDEAAATAADSQPDTSLKLGKPANGLTESQVYSYMANGVTPEAADELLAKDISRNEKEVKQVLSSVGVKSVPQGAFDGLVSMQNQLGDISYAYVKGEKIDLTGLYRQGDWQRVASFIAADERDKSRRIQEATMIARGEYGPAVNPNEIIKKGFDVANERLAKDQLNKQTGAPATGQQKVALANSYFSANQTSLPNASAPLKLAAAKNFAEEYITKRYKRQAGPWPY